MDYKRPCERSCKVKAISMSESKAASIDNSKCISCGACVYQCPFGAITDKSFILNAIDMLKKSDNNQKYKVYGVVAPSISSQFTYAKLGQVLSGIKALGFYTIVEAALGADMVAFSESKELAEKGFLTSSCCPALYTPRGMRRINGFANLLKRANRCPLMLKTQRFITSAPLPQSPDRS